KADRFNTNADRIYRIITERVNDPRFFNKYATTSLPIAPALEDNLSTLEEAVRIRRGFGNSWTGDLDDPTVPISGYFVDPEFMDFFQFELSAGDVNKALIEPYTVVLTKSAALKLFGETDVLGQELDMEEKGIYKVTGILKDTDNVTHLSFDALASMESARSLEADSVMNPEIDSWSNTTAGWIYIRLTDPGNAADVTAYLDDLYEEHFGDIENVNLAFRLQELTRIKPGPVMGNEIGPFMPWLFVYILGGLGLIIMGSSCFNYINLTIARSMNRSREIGIRKVNGASRRQVFAQFIVESVMVCLVALILGIVLLLFLEPAFSRLNFARILQWELSHDWWVWLAIIGFTLATGLIAGVFPALTLSSFRPINIFRDMHRSKVFSRVFIRKFLLVGQFSVSLIFIISVILQYKQVEMMMKADFGFDSAGVLTVPYDADTYQTMKNELTASSLFSNVTVTSHIPVSGNSYGNTLKRNPGDEDNGMNYFSGEPGYLNTLGVPLLAGRDLKPRKEGQPESEVLLNEAAVKELGFRSNSDAIGSLVYTSDTSSLNVVGVFPSYHHEALVLNIEPLAIRILPESYNYVQMRVAPGNEEIARQQAIDIWKKHNPGKVLRARYIKEYVTEFHEIMFGDLMSILLVISVIASFVACLGLLGITIFSTEQKVKEISIRKVMGAADTQLFVFLSKGFLFLVGLAVLIAIPVSWFLNSLWLQQMAYRVDL
ncbi:MAG: ABC transporter permease, partial [Cyclobacteriaceae bacterium]